MAFVKPLPTGCWVWTGYIRNGLGRFRWGKRMEMAHRAAYILFVDPIPEHFEVTQKCKRRDCVNPAHLIAVTHFDNRQKRIK
jgi:hypothetical protein